MKLPFCICALLFIVSCGDNDDDFSPERADSMKKVNEYIRPIEGKSERIPENVRDSGEVLVAYSDCYTCHTIDKRSKGPAFRDIARRYPVNDGYVELLAQRIIIGGSGAWGHSVMNPHPSLSVNDAKTMVKFILSLKD
jgi:cytochrome c